jgi:hypothetical protein
MALSQLTVTEINALMRRPPGTFKPSASVCLQSGASVRITNRRNAFFPDEVLRDARAIVLEEEAMHNPGFIAELPTTSTNLAARGHRFSP